MEANKRFKVHYLQLRPQQISIKNNMTFIIIARKGKNIYFLQSFKEHVLGQTGPFKLHFSTIPQT